MNFGKRATNKKRNALTSHSTMIGKKAHVSLLRIILLSLLAIMVIGVCAGLGAFKGVLDSAPNISEVNIVPVGDRKSVV